MISASAACRLGIAAYGFASARTIALSWLIPKPASVSTKPSSGNMRGGAVGTSTKPIRPMHVREQDRVAEPDERLVAAGDRPTAATSPSTVNWECQYVHEVSLAKHVRRRDEALERELPQPGEAMLEVGDAPDRCETP